MNQEPNLVLSLTGYSGDATSFFSKAPSIFTWKIEVLAIINPSSCTLLNYKTFLNICTAHFSRKIIHSLHITLKFGNCDLRLKL